MIFGKKTLVVLHLKVSQKICSIQKKICRTTLSAGRRKHCHLDVFPESYVSYVMSWHLMNEINWKIWSKHRCQLSIHKTYQPVFVCVVPMFFPMFWYISICLPDFPMFCCLGSPLSLLKPVIFNLTLNPLPSGVALPPCCNAGAKDFGLGSLVMAY